MTALRWLLVPPLILCSWAAAWVRVPLGLVVALVVGLGWVGVARLYAAPVPARFAPVAHFAPGPGCRDEAVRVIDGAESTIRLSAYGLSEPRILDALARAKGRGVDVEVLVDRTNEGHTAIAELAGLGVDVRFDEREPIAHTKSIVADGRVVLAGSANWTPSSMKDREVCVTNIDAGLAAALEADFARHRLHAVGDR